MSVEVFDEEIALRRFEVALKRADWRMFGDAVARLGEELEAGSPFARLADWRDLVRRAGEHEELPAELTTGLRAMVARVLDVDARVLGSPAAPAADGPALVVVDLWRSGLDAPGRLDAFRAWLGRPGAASAAAGRRQLQAWLDEGAALADLVARAQLALAADRAGLALAQPPFAELVFAGLRATADAAATPSLAEALVGQGPAVVLTGDPAPAPGTEDAMALRLGGGLDLFYCAACREAAPAPGAIVAACPECAGPAWPLVVPPGASDLLPPPLRRAWEQAADALRAAPTWVLVDPPAPDDPLAAWVLDRLPADRRVFVVGAEDDHRAWRLRLEAGHAAEVVTSKGPAEEQLAYLLGGAAGLDAEAARPEPRAGGFAPGKKKKR